MVCEASDACVWVQCMCAQGKRLGCVCDVKVSVGDSAVKCRLDKRSRHLGPEAGDPGCLRGRRPLTKAEQTRCE